MASKTFDVRKLAKKKLREQRKDDGYFDGRFSERSVCSKKKYKRNKHKLDWDGKDN